MYHDVCWLRRTARLGLMTGLDYWGYALAMSPQRADALYFLSSRVCCVPTEVSCYRIYTHAVHKCGLFFNLIYPLCRLAKLARSRASYVPLPGSSPPPPPRTATLPQSSSAAASAGNGNAQAPRISTAQTCATSTGGVVMTSTLPARPGIGPLPDNNSNDRLQRMSSVSAPRARPCSAVVAATSIGGTSTGSNARQCTSVTISHDDLLDTLRGARPWHKGNLGSAVEASAGGASMKVTSMGGAMPGGSRGSGKSKAPAMQLGGGAGAVRNNRLFDRYAAGASGCDDPLVSQPLGGNSEWKGGR